VQHVGPGIFHFPQDIAGRRLLLFKEQKERIISQPREEGAYQCQSSAPLNSSDNRSLGQSSCSVSPYSCITIQLQSPHRLCRRLAPRTPL
jgi:hypothetical protein